MNTTLQPIIDDVLSLEDFAPSDDVNRIMSSLVYGVINTRDFDVSTLNASRQAVDVRRISAATESELEKFWARLIITADHPQEALKTFPYLDNYRELTERELELIERSGLAAGDITRILVIGSGALPLSAYELGRQTGAIVDHVDSSPEAIRLCRQVTEKLGASSNYYGSRGETVALDGMYDLILIAALAGATAQDKQKIINTVLPHLTNDGRIILRSARGSRTLLYPGIHSDDVSGLTLLEEYHPTDYIINSVFVYGR